MTAGYPLCTRVHRPGGCLCEGFGSGGDQGSTEDGRGEPGEGAAGDEVGGGG